MSTIFRVVQTFKFDNVFMNEEDAEKFIDKRLDNDHWSSPNGCPPDCPACEERATYEVIEDEI